jgi:hypothetical protein
MVTGPQCWIEDSAPHSECVAVKGKPVKRGAIVKFRVLRKRLKRRPTTLRRQKPVLGEGESTVLSHGDDAISSERLGQGLRIKLSLTQVAQLVVYK